MDPRFEVGARLAGTRVPGQIHGGGRGKVRRKNRNDFFKNALFSLVIIFMWKNRFFTSSLDGEIKEWDPATGEFRQMYIMMVNKYGKLIVAKFK